YTKFAAAVFGSREHLCAPLTVSTTTEEHHENIVIRCTDSGYHHSWTDLICPNNPRRPPGWVVRFRKDCPLRNTARKSATGAEDTRLLRRHCERSKSDLGKGIRFCRC